MAACRRSMRVNALWPHIVKSGSIGHRPSSCIMCTRSTVKYLYSTSANKILSLRDRGVLQAVFPEESVPELSRHLSSPQTVYCGFDPTSDSLHIGNLLALIALLRFQAAGHTPIAVVGGATALIGDPSGKTSTRQDLSAEEVEKNVQKIFENLQQVVNNYNSHIWKDPRKKLPPFRVLNNMDWYSEKNVIKFTSRVCRHFWTGQMLKKYRMEDQSGSSEVLSLAEFIYPVLQAYDWLHLLQQHKCSIQIGGSDQMDNFVAGHELISKVSRHKVFGLTVPLVTTTMGDKLGKTAGNSVWLDPKKTSPFELYQYFINKADADVERYLKLFTFLSIQDIDTLMSKQKAAPENRVAQKVLAEQVTLLVHGDVGLESAVRWTNALYGSSIDALATLTAGELGQLLGQVPVQEMFFQPDITILDLCMKAGCFTRIRDAERIIKAGGVYLNHRRVQQPDFALVPGEHILSNNTTLIRVGKKNYYIVSWCQ